MHLNQAKNDNMLFTLNIYLQKIKLMHIIYIYYYYTLGLKLLAFSSKKDLMTLLGS